MMCYFGHPSHFYEGETEADKPVKIIYQIRVCQWLEETEAFRNEFIHRSKHSVPISQNRDDISISARFTGCFVRCFPYCIWKRDILY